jgi:3-mercaptopyruvate sulfurtransferase SseA
MRKLLLAFFEILLVIIFALPASAHHQDTTAISKEELLKMLDSPDLIILDVRLIGDYETSPIQIKGALRTTLPEVESWARMIPNTKTIVVYGNAENDTNSTAIAFKLQELGFKHVFYLEGGWEDWINASYPVEEK